MKDMISYYEKLKADAADCAMIEGLSIDKKKRELFSLLSAQIETLATEVERVITARANERQ